MYSRKTESKENLDCDLQLPCQERLNEDGLDEFAAYKEETLSEFPSLLDYLKRKNEEYLKELFNAIRGPKHND